ncbi:hypothetical protein HDV01_006692 [Terramyces sp. JEL0728]|nr:hypothetical protein HDV01_006692 [Terramyces sp. JEL0728]
MNRCIGCVGSILVFASTLRNKIENSMLLTLSLCMADFIYTANVLFFITAELYYDHFPFSKTGCEINYFIAMYSSISSGKSLLFIMIERYMLIFYNIEYSTRFFTVALSIIWVAPFIFTMLPIFTGELESTLALGPSKTYCSFAFTIHEPLVLTSIIFVLAILGLTVTLLFFGYYRIVYFYIKNNQKTKQKKGLSSRELELIKKALVICLTFFVCWSPMAVTIAYQEITQNLISARTDIIVGLICCLNSVLNPFLVIAFDSRIKQNVFYTLGIHYQANID